MISIAQAASGSDAQGGLLADPTIWVAVALVMLITLIVVKGRKAIIGGLDKRADDIRRKLDEAEKLRDEAQNTLAAYQRKQRDAMDEADQIVAQAKEAAAHLREQAVTEAQRTMERREKLALEKIAQAEAAAMAAVRAHAVDVAIDATAALLADKMDKKQADKLADAAIAELKDKLN